MGDHGPTIQIYPIYTRTHKLQCSEVCKDLYSLSVILARSSKTIISDRGSQFIARFWKQLHVSLRTHLIHSLAYHLHTNGQTECINQILEDMLRAYVLEHQGSWDENLPWVEFSYNNSYQESLKMAPFEVLYRHRCHTPLNWIELGEKVIFRPDLVEEVEATVRSIQDNLEAAKSHQETYEKRRH
jgi:transposase InsO family protein